MGSEGEKQWQFVIGTSLTILFGVVGVAFLPDANAKLLVAGAMALGALALAVNAVAFTPKAATPPAADTSVQDNGTTPPVASVPSLEDKENPALLIAAGYVPTEYPHRWEKRQPDVDAPFEETGVMIYDETGNFETSASVFLVLNDCAWVPGSAKYFKNRNNTPCRLETLLAFPEFQDRLSSARHLIFVGMESYLNAPKAASSDHCDHEWLTACRADRLITRTYNEYFSDASKSRPDLWELDLGYANSKSLALEWDQRRAVILGIRNRRPGLTVEDAVTKLVTGSKVGTIKLADYSKSATTRAVKVPYSAWGSDGSADSHR